MFRILAAAALLFALFSFTPAKACIGLGCTCSVSVDDVTFGTYDFLAGSLDAASNVEVTCSALVVGVNFNYTVEADGGLSADMTNRHMSNGADTLHYNLYADAARTQIWGDGTSGTTVIADGYPLEILIPVTKNYPVYGRIPGGQVTPPGFYSDTLTVTVTY
ncbi:Csu type fimbrial protein [Emcibacter nanhaiensis]|uniref:Spore coat protein U domain-containing protein n=1 Tax=Emcibacter nanhaiensis TaxID=1505037 RepID=A0A501PCY9_9PROT|nr:spore coat U domain-containing protein [Emcibacter nanhaiensis]TPD57911.1 spore coat protein U domain-containing protein [Emcibacter nanhaiensis]